MRKTIARYANDQVLTDDELAWLTVLLPITPIRDAAWRATDDEPWHVAMWSDITRRAQPRLAAPPASLLAFAAWRSGNGALAGVAVDRALHANPTYSPAQLIDQALREGLPPSVLDEWPDQGFPPRPDPGQPQSVEPEETYVRLPRRFSTTRPLEWYRPHTELPHTTAQ